MDRQKKLGRPRGERHDWIVIGLQVSPEMAAKLADLPRGAKGRTVDAALRSWFEAGRSVEEAG